MSKSSGNESALSSKAKAAIKDLNSLEGRYGTYVSSIDRGVEAGQLHEIYNHQITLS